MENLNFVDIFVLLFLVGFLLDGYFKGFVLTLVNLARSVVGYALCFFASTRLTPIVYDNYAKSIIYDKINAKLSEVANIDALIDNVKNSVNELPSNLRDAVDLTALDNVSNDNAMDFIMDSLVEPVATIVIKGIIFVLVFILFFVLTSVIISLIKKLRKNDKSKLKTADKVLGGVFGVAKYWLVVSALVAVFNMIVPYTTQTEGIIAMVQSSYVYDFFNQYNLFNVILGGI